MTTINLPSAPEFLCIGFFCHDLHEGDYILGGTASYASLMASQLGKRTAVMTSVGNDFEYFEVFKNNNIEVFNKPANKTTVFNNIYENGNRIQFIYDPAEKLFLNDLPNQWRQSSIVKFCLIADEVDFSLLNAFPNSLVGATIQGWLRQWDETGKISPKKINWELLKPVDIIFFSDADIENLETTLPEIIKTVKTVVMTKGANGVSIFQQNNTFEFPSFPINEVDPTGAGDIFATAFLLHFYQTKNIALSAAFAHAAASLVVEEIGPKIPTKAQIEERYDEYKRRFIN
ncbi:MAG: PfkB family carbohydrate kinase [Saprospiraceae bacterium]